MSIWLGHKVPRQLLQNYSGCVSQGVPGEITFQSVDTAPSTVGGPYPISWGPEQNKRADPPLSKKELLPAWLLEPGHWSFLPLDLNWNISSSWVSGLLAFRLELHHPFSWFSGLWSWKGLEQLNLESGLKKFRQLSGYVKKESSEIKIQWKCDLDRRALEWAS